MLSIHFTLPQVLGFIRTIVERNPEHVAKAPNGGQGCIYMVKSDNGFLTPVCIVGQMFADLGLLRLLLLDPSNLSEYGDQYGACAVKGEFWDGLGAFGITADEDAQEFLREVQYNQDSGSTWGDSLATTIEQWQAKENAKMDDEQRTLDRKRQALVDLFS
jgi:hypothetical protein